MAYLVPLHHSWSWKKRSHVSSRLLPSYSQNMVLISCLPLQIPGNRSNIQRIEMSSKSTSTGVLLLYTGILGAKTSKPYRDHALHFKAAVLQER
jgi:hypothetical protein